MVMMATMQQDTIGTVGYLDASCHDHVIESNDPPYRVTSGKVEAVTKQHGSLVFESGDIIDSVYYGNSRSML